MCFKNTLTNQDDEQLVLSFLKGNKACFEVLFDRYLYRIVRYISTLIKDPDEAKDLSQEVFIKVHKALPTYKSSGKFSSWLFTIARRTVIDSQRKKKRAIVFKIRDEELQDIPGETSADEKLVEESVSEILQGINEAHKEILLLRIVEGMSYNKIAEITGQTAGNLRKIVYRTIKKLYPDNDREQTQEN
ncbi:MAG: RNA polymerase sigma factor [Candidatus Rifleibacteriota bacterium]